MLHELALHLGLVNGSHGLADVEKASGDRVAHTLARAPSDVLSYQLRSTSDVLLGSPRPRGVRTQFPLARHVFNSSLRGTIHLLKGFIPLRDPAGRAVEQQLR